MADEPKQDNPDGTELTVQKYSGRVDKEVNSRVIPVQWRKTRVDFPLMQAKGEGEALLNVLKGNSAPHTAPPEGPEYTGGVPENA